MSAPLTEPSLSGTLLAGRYEIRALLGRGGMGEVFEAVDRRLGRTVAIKVLQAELASDERFLARFRREASTAARLAHVGIVSVYDIGDDAGRTFIVMELVAGRSLDDVARAGATLDAPRVARIGSAAARALAHAHDRGVVHRDVSPSNIMVTADGTVKLLDFGIARGGSAAMGPTAASRGTAAYLAPEVLRGGRIDARADVYALGVVLRELGDGVDDPQLIETLERATASDPGARYVSAAAFADALDTIGGAVDQASAPRELVDPSLGAGDRTERIVRIATRPLDSAPIERAAPRLPLQPLVGPVHGVSLPPARGIAVAGTRRRPRRGRAVRSAVTVALVLAALGGAVVLGQAFGSMSSPQAAATVVGPDPVPAPGDLVATSSCDGMFSTGVDLAWTGTAPVKGYEIWRGGGSGVPDGIDVGTGDRELVARVRGVHTEAFRDVDLGVDASYTYRVRAYDGPRVSRWSNVVEVATPFLCLT